jgi:hypothetical protein
MTHACIEQHMVRVHAFDPVAIHLLLDVWPRVHLPAAVEDDVAYACRRTSEPCGSAAWSTLTRAVEASYGAERWSRRRGEDAASSACADGEAWRLDRIFKQIHLLTFTGILTINLTI